jgi:excisionase family DNA binding protein
MEMAIVREGTTVQTTAAKTLLTIRQAARAFGLPEYALRNWAKAGHLPHLKAGSRVYLVPAAIEAFLAGAAKP